LPKGKLLNGLVTQQKVLRSAVALFLEKGYTRTTTGEIATAAGIGQSSFFHVFPSKEALLLELVQRMFAGQFDLAGQHSGAEDPVFLYAVETALQLHIAELTEPLRELYVMGYTLPSTSAFIYRSTAARLQKIFGPYVPGAQPKDFYEMEIASGSIMRGFMSVPCDVYFTMEAKISRFLDCSLKLYDVPKEKRAAITAAVLRMDLHTMASGIIQKTVQQAEKGFEALTEKQI
jgi:transcriptional regulator